MAYAVSILDGQALDSPESLDREWIQEMRGWLSDCGIADAYTATVRGVVRYVHRHYDGGVSGFVREAGF